MGTPISVFQGRRCLDAALLCTSCFVPAAGRAVWLLYSFSWMGGIGSGPWAARRGLAFALLLVLPGRRLSVSWLQCCRAKALQGHRLSETGLQQLVPLQSSKLTAPDCLCLSQSSMKSVLAKNKHSDVAVLWYTSRGPPPNYSCRTPSKWFSFPALSMLSLRLHASAGAEREEAVSKGGRQLASKG